VRVHHEHCYGHFLERDEHGLLHEGELVVGGFLNLCWAMEIEDGYF
jgi:hypothetical protein